MIDKVFYPGSFDPVTLGHLDLVERGARLFDQVVVGVGINPNKQSLFTPDERVEMICDHAGQIEGLEVVTFEGLAVAAARQLGCRALLRGIRTMSDFETEYQMALTNTILDPEIETIFLAPSERFACLSSRLIKEVVQSGGRIDRFLPPELNDRVRARLAETRPHD